MQDLKTLKFPLRKKNITKLGTIKIGVVETTPVVFEDKLLRFEWVRNKNWGGGTETSKDNGYYHFVDMATEDPVSSCFAVDHSFGCAYTENGLMYAHGVRGNGGGNGGDDLLVGGASKNMFFYAYGNGNDTIKNAKPINTILYSFT